MKNLIPFLLILLFVISVPAQLALVTAEKANLRGTPASSGKIVETVSRGTPLEIIKRKGVWFLVQSEDYAGWVHGNAIKLDNPAEKEATLPPAGAADLPAAPYIAPPAVPSSRTYIRGPRGGCYYINSNGNKTYVDRSLCG